MGHLTGLTDPDLGQGWQYTYPLNPTPSNPLWLVQDQTDAAGQTITYTYDLLDRVLTKSGTNLSANYTYDTSQNGIGHRATMSDGAGSASYAYDKRGRLTTLTRTINSVPYAITTSYDAQDRVLSITFPNGAVLGYRYGDHGMAVGLMSFAGRE